MDFFKNARAVLLPILTLLAVFSAASQTAQDEEKVLDITDFGEATGDIQEPLYPGGIEALYDFICQNLTYPKSAVEQNIEGRVIIQFIVTKDGNVADAKVVKSVYPDLDAEALRVVRLLKGFIPGKKGAENINVWYTIPFNFKLPDDNPVKEEN